MSTDDVTTTTMPGSLDVGVNNGFNNDKNAGSVAVYQLRSSRGPQHAVWDLEQALYLRKARGLLGDFVGTLPKHLSQNQFLTMPLFLNDDEVTHGLEGDVLHVLSDHPEDYEKPTSETVEAYEAEREAEMSRQVEEAVIKQRDERQRRQIAVTPKKRKHAEIAPRSNVVTKKHRNRHEGNTNAREIQNNPPDNDDVQMGNNEKLNGNREQEADDDYESEPATKMQRVGLFGRISQGVRAVFQSIFSFSSPTPPPLPPPPRPPRQAMNETEEHVTKNKLTTSQKRMETTYDKLKDETSTAQWREDARQKVLDEKARHQARLSCLVVTPTCARDDEVDDAKRRQIVRYEDIPPPFGMSESRRRWRRAVFDDLRKRGYVISCGAKFGADFLAYAGDPQLFHAALAVVVVEGAQAISARDIVALGRLGDSTRKRTVLAWVDDNSEEKDEYVSIVHYVGVQWEETLP